MSPRLVMKRLRSNCQARRTNQQPINAPELLLSLHILFVSQKALCPDAQVIIDVATMVLRRKKTRVVM
ncbi:hypothetical protein T265_01330 [Opisthorchis viverrini]|uniref:Uncharacterized protein n=1 Tax=Opisthorchis viverrini TaxID=6198 RepID=A0A074ZYW4_OPIVI|nr:hypothetical protein T265_01330 [Opisthorchis viverrini]KER32643.1 hypothetical protein T265_01330 [Opisthorchis viverrini]